MEKDFTVIGNDPGAKVFVIGIGNVGTHFFRIQDYGVTCLQDAIDAIADYCEENNFHGFFASEEEIEENDSVYLEDYYTPAGNHDRLFTNEIHVLREE
jgi:hypothetical protein